MGVEGEKAIAGRTRVFRLIQWIFVADILVGALIRYFAEAIGGGDANLVGALELVGLGLIVVGAVGYLMFVALAHGARKRAR